ncbi:MAG: asparagine synthase (glutamine-hydrolyzing) [Acidobacteriota bacterium]
MCGICGTLAREDARPDRTAVARMAGAMVHRGPDDDGFYADGRVALGFRRLSIIDVAGGHQPLANEDGALRLVFNGEIYNHLDHRRQLERRGHRFQTRSDGEVILHLYEERGVDFVDDLNGIFAFALWDARQDRLLLARDHHGVKPLYWTSQQGTLIFASEIKALLASGLVPRVIDPEAVAQYLAYQVVPPPLSIIEGVHVLPPGRLLVHARGRTTVRAYWQPPVEPADPVTDPHDAQALVRRGLEDAVRAQMMSERPLGVFLSGGVDSSALVALASQHVAHRLKTFSVGFVGPDEAVLSELPWARIVADRYGTDHEEFVLTERMFLEALPHALWAMDQPTSDAINSYWVSFAAAREVTVALSGTGGDELFLGYDRDARLIEGAAAASALLDLPVGYLRGLARRLDRVDTASLWPGAARLVEGLRATALLDREFVSPRAMGIYDDHERLRILHGARAPRASSGFLGDDVPPNAAEPGDWVSRLEQRAYLSYVLLRDIDAMAMAHSLEVRVPLLDPRFTEAMSRISWRLKYRDGTGKWVLKQALRDLLPDDILFRRKMGFGLPYYVWMRRSVEPYVRDLLAPDRVRRRGVFRPDAVEALVRRFYGGDDGVWRRVWTLMVLEGWADQVLDRQEVAAHVAAA